MKVALSPCPNDTYLFHGWIEGHISTDLSIEPYYADIDQLNRWAMAQQFPLIKVSFPCFAKIIDHYELLPVGVALGHRCGPKLVATSYFATDQLPHKSVAIPGNETTAHLLLNRLLPSPKEKCFLPYHTIPSQIKNGIVDCGLVIHESRFTYQKEGLVEIADLGELWHLKSQAPLPLGGLVIARNLPPSIKNKVVDTLRHSLQHAANHRGEQINFMLQYSQEKDPEIIWKHVDTYVTTETASLSQRGIEAIETLIGCGSYKNWLWVVDLLRN